MTTRAFRYAAFSFRVRSESREVFDHIDRHYSWLSPGTGTSRRFDAVIHRQRGGLDARQAEWTKGLPRLGRYVFAAPKRVVRRLSEWCLLRVDKAGVEVAYVPKAGSVRLNYALRMALHFPLFSALEAKGIGVLHGAAVEKDGRAVVLSGFDGAGKSTLALHLCRAYGYRLLADNFVLFDAAGRLYPFLESTRLAPDSAKALALEGGVGKDARGRRACLATADLSSAHRRVKAVKIVHTFLGARDRLLPAAPAALARVFASAQQSAPEFRDFDAFKGALNLLRPALDTCREQKILDDFLRSARGYTLEKSGLAGLERQAQLLG